MLEVLPAGRNSTYHCPQGCSRKELQCCSCPLSSGAQILCRTICRPGKNLLLVCQLMVGNFPLRHRLGKKWSYNRSGDHGHFGHCSCKLVVPSGHMAEHCRVVDTQLYSSDNTQFIMCSSDCMVSGGSWLSVQDLVVGLELLLKGLLLLLVEDGRILSPNPKGLCYV